MSEADQVRQRYERRKEKGLAKTQGQFTAFVHFSRAEREFVGTQFLHKAFADRLGEVRALEIGAGHGDNVHFLMRSGIAWKNIYLNELLEDRLASLAEWFPKDRTLPGDILTCDLPEGLELIYQSTVFSSILDTEVQKAIVEKAAQALRPGGLFLWYDFCFDNPKNKDVKGISAADVVRLMSPLFDLVEEKRVALAPPIGRRVGRAYGLFNGLFPFLRTHRMMLFKKRGGE